MPTKTPSPTDLATEALALESLAQPDIADDAQLAAEVRQFAAASARLTATKAAAEEAIQAAGAEFVESIENLAAEAKRLEKRISRYALAHRAELFQGGQSVEVGGHDLEFRVSPGAVDFGSTKEADLVEQILALPADQTPLKRRLLQFSSKPIKRIITAILQSKAQADQAAAALLRGLGVSVVKPERFSIRVRHAALPEELRQVALTEEGA